MFFEHRPAFVGRAGGAVLEHVDGGWSAGCRLASPPHKAVAGRDWLTLSESTPTVTPVPSG